MSIVGLIHNRGINGFERQVSCNSYFLFLYFRCLLNVGYREKLLVVKRGKFSFNTATQENYRIKFYLFWTTETKL